MALRDVNFNDIYTFERASTATYFDSNGVLQTAAVDEPRFDRDPVTGEPSGLVVESGATNIFPNSLMTSGWTTNGISREFGFPSPDGKGEALEISLPAIEDNGQNYTSRLYYGFPTQSGEVVGFSVFAKWIAGGARYLCLKFDSGPSTFFDLIEGTIARTTSPASKMENCGGGWFRCMMLNAVGNDSNNNHFIWFTNRTNGSSLDPPPSGDEVFHIWGAQAEKGGSLSSYIPTSGSPVSRAADIITTRGDI